MMKTGEKEIEPQVVIKQECLYKKTYCFNVEISKSPIPLSFYPSLKISRKKLNGVGSFGKSILQEVFKVPGVNSVSIEPCELSVTKNYFFKWYGINSRIIEAFDKCLKKEGIKEDIKIISGD